MRKITACLVVFVLVLFSLPLGSADGELDLYVSRPGNIPNLSKFDTPQ